MVKLISPIDSGVLMAAIQAHTKGDYDTLEVHEILYIINQQPSLIFCGLGFQGKWEPFDDFPAKPWSSVSTRAQLSGLAVFARKLLLLWTLLKKNIFPTFAHGAVQE